MYNKSDYLVGSDLIASVVTVVDPTAGATSILTKIPITPSAYPGTRLTALSNLWERYRFRKFNLRFVSAMPLTVGCQLVVYLDTDPTDDPSGLPFEQIMRQATAQTGSQQFNFNRDKVVQLAQRIDNQFYYTGIDKENIRFTQQGTFYVLQISTVNDINGVPASTPLVCGNLYIDWEIEMQIPQINVVGVVPPTFTYDSNSPMSSPLTSSTSLRHVLTTKARPGRLYIGFANVLDATCVSGGDTVFQAIGPSIVSYPNGGGPGGIEVPLVIGFIAAGRASVNGFLYARSYDDGTGDVVVEYNRLNGADLVWSAGIVGINWYLIGNI
jgi:hypothetical protein